MKTFPLALVLLTLTACSEMQPSPVAPSATSPVPAQTPITTPPTSVPRFAVDIHANGRAVTNQPWSTTVLVSRIDGGVGGELPASVSFDCGTGSPRVLAGFVGASILTCSFASAGAYAVQASVVAPNGVTTSNSLTVMADTPADPYAYYLDITVTRLSPVTNGEEWRITVSGAEPGSTFHYDFGDGASTDTSARTAQHIYANGRYTVEVTATSPSGRVIRASNNIRVPEEG